ncbi:hypothetical protein MUK42_11336 [Musa troglodytarum]|uniref:Uncharacterized protein n=1 Tax=Musa troglodytarum TaxID=320322 RepID=A0A9E7GHQ7_9LILI|nr:hypothetical protein MUK42_11336 [Musa troglodytarum]
MENGERRPTAEEVIARLKDDGDFDSLRLKIIRKVKENEFLECDMELILEEALVAPTADKGVSTLCPSTAVVLGGILLHAQEELRSSIVSEVRQSMVLNEDGSEKLKLRQLSDAIYQELGSKIMGQISDEVWKVIKSCENDIRGTVESVYDRIVKPEVNKQDSASPQKRLPVGDEKDQASLVTPSTCETNVSDGNEQMEVPPGFCSTDQPSSKVEHAMMLRDEQPHSSNEVLNDPEQIDAVPPGFGPPVNSSIIPVGVSDEDPDVPPVFKLKVEYKESNLLWKYPNN